MTHSRPDADEADQLFEQLRAEIDAERSSVEASETEQLYAQVRRAIDQERGWVAWLRARSTMVRTVLMAMVFAGTVALAVSMTGHGAFFLDAEPRWVISVLGLAGLVGVAVRATLRPVHRPAWSRPARALIGVAILVGSLCAIVLIGDGSAGAVGSGQCVFVGLMTGAPIFGGVLLIDRRPHRGPLFAALAGAVAGATTTQILCPLPGALHLLVQHFGIVVVGVLLFGAVAAWASRRDVPRVGP